MKRKVTLIKNCPSCPDFGECGPSSKLTKREKAIISLVGNVKHRFPDDCPLEDVTEEDKKISGG